MAGENEQGNNSVWTQSAKGENCLRKQADVTYYACKQQ
jgi:hypothetical protein